MRDNYRDECVAELKLLYWRLYGIKPNSIEDLTIEELEADIRTFTKEWNERLTNQ